MSSTVRMLRDEAAAADATGGLVEINSSLLRAIADEIEGLTVANESYRQRFLDFIETDELTFKKAADALFADHKGEGK